MKKLICTALLAALLLSGCGKSEQQSASAAPSARPLPDSAASFVEESLAQENAQSAEKAIDIDLVGMNSNMIFAQVSDMVRYPEHYVGKTVRIMGQFNVFENPDLNKNYYVVMIADALACCQEGMEFVWQGEHAYPQDYPALGTEVRVTGVFATYEEGGALFCTLVDSSLEVQ